MGDKIEDKMFKPTVTAWRPTPEDEDALKQVILEQNDNLQPIFQVYKQLKGNKGKAANIEITMKPEDQTDFDILKCGICHTIPLEKFLTCNGDANKGKTTVDNCGFIKCRPCYEDDKSAKKNKCNSCSSTLRPFNSDKYNRLMGMIKKLEFKCDATVGTKLEEEC